MTTQSPECFIYRGENLYSHCEPLKPFLEQNPEINLYYPSSTNWRNYQGYWEIKDNKLYLKNIECLNYTLNDIFKTNEPVFADWFIGEISLGIGNSTYDEYSTYYENYLLINIDKGIVTDKKIIKRSLDNYKMTFGKYKGTYIGKLLYSNFTSDSSSSTIVDYIKEILEFFTNNQFSNRIYIPYFEITEQHKKLLNSTRMYNYNYFITPKYIIVTSNSLVESDNAIELSILIEYILGLDFGKLMIVKNSKIEGDIPISEKTNFINPDFSYIKWAIENVDNFYVPPSLFVEKNEKDKLKKFEIKRITPTIIEYKPVFEEYNFSPIKDLIIKNNEKFEQLTNLKYNLNEDYYEYNISKNELLEKFGFYLDENYIVNDNQDIKEYYERGESYGKYSDSYAQYYEGLSDDFIDDVLDGDPDAYWNID